MAKRINEALRRHLEANGKKGLIELALLQRGIRTVQEIAWWIQASYNTVYRTLKRNPDRFEQMEDGRWRVRQ